MNVPGYQLFSQYGDIGGGINADSYLITFDLQHGNSDFPGHRRLGAIIVTGIIYKDGFAWTAREYKHVSLLADLAEYMWSI